MGRAWRTQNIQIIDCKQHMRRTIRSQKQTNANLPLLPASITVIPTLPAQYQTTLSLVSGQQFGSPEGVTLLQQSGSWFCNGTFKVVPELFYQLNTVHALTGTKVFLCLTSKQNSSHLRSIVPPTSRCHIMVYPP